MKILGLMLASNTCEGGKCYSKMVEACRNTWAKNSTNIDIYSIYGTDNPIRSTYGSCKTNNYDIIINTIESRRNLLHKTIKAIEFCLHNMEFDFLFRPNCGSYINTNLLYNFLLDKPKDKYYDGINGMYDGIKYSSGACILMSRDVAELLIEKQNLLEYDGAIYMDDVSIGKFFIEQKIELQKNALREDCISETDLVSKFNNRCYHYYFCHTINPDLIYKCHNLTINSKQ